MDRIWIVFAGGVRFPATAVFYALFGQISCFAPLPLLPFSIDADVLHYYSFKFYWWLWQLNSYFALKKSLILVFLA
jgi:hypothetical protein